MYGVNSDCIATIIVGRELLHVPRMFAVVKVPHPKSAFSNFPKFLKMHYDNSELRKIVKFSGSKQHFLLHISVYYISG